MIIKKFVPCIYLYHEHAVRNLTDTTIVDTDPVRLADYYCEHNADELIVFDMSEDDDLYQGGSGCHRCRQCQAYGGH